MDFQGPGLSRDQARAVYDRIGALQDTQQFYEDAAVRTLIAHADLGNAGSIVEFGCGTGRHAARMLRKHLPADAHYLGIDQSSTMVRLCRARLRPWSDRSAVWQSDGRPQVTAPDASFDRFFSTYVLDLLSEDDIAAVLAEAHRLLNQAGRLCLVGLTYGETPLQRRVVSLLQRLHRFRPSLVGGCRPINLGAFVDSSRWRLLHRELVSRLGIPSEVVVALPLR